MGYTTDFKGQINIDPPLSKKECDYLHKFNDSRRMIRNNGPYFVDGNGDFGQARDSDILDHNTPPDCQPGLWCQWMPNEDGTAIEWDGGEKFYEAENWMAYLRTHFITLGAAKILSPETQSFWKPHRMSGEILAIGESASEDVWKLIVNDEGVFVSAGTWTDDAQARLFDRDDDDYVDSDDAFEFLEANPGAVTFEEPRKIADYKMPEQEALVQAQKDKQILEKTTPKRPARTPGSQGRI